MHRSFRVFLSGLRHSGKPLAVSKRNQVGGIGEEQKAEYPWMGARHPFCSSDTLRRPHGTSALSVAF